MLAWLSVWSEVQTCIWPRRCQCYSLSLASVKSRLVLPFWYRLTRVVSEKGLLNGCVCVLQREKKEQTDGWTDPWLCLLKHLLSADRLHQVTWHVRMLDDVLAQTVSAATRSTIQQSNDTRTLTTLSQSIDYRLEKCLIYSKPDRPGIRTAKCRI